jgi:hypothetical protein
MILRSIDAAPVVEMDGRGPSRNATVEMNTTHAGKREKDRDRAQME